MSAAMRDCAIGVFDSGIGGLTVVRELKRLLPAEDIIYFGDTARLPYGSKSERAITRFAIEDAVFLASQNVKAIVIACNTVSAVAFTFLRGFIRLPIVGVVEPGARAAVRVTKSKEIGVIGTKTTVRQHAYAKAVKALDPEVEVHEIETPLLVHLVEENWVERRVTGEILREYLAPLLGGSVDTLILGCTHYPLLAGPLGAVAPGLTLIDSALETALSVKNILERHDLLAGGSRSASIEVYVSDYHPDCERWAGMILEDSVPVKQVEPLHLNI